MIERISMQSMAASEEFRRGVKRSFLYVTLERMGRNPMMTLTRERIKERQVRLLREMTLDDCDRAVEMGRKR